MALTVASTWIMSAMGRWGFSAIPVRQRVWGLIERRPIRGAGALLPRRIRRSGERPVIGSLDASEVRLTGGGATAPEGQRDVSVRRTFPVGKAERIRGPLHAARAAKADAPHAVRRARLTPCESRENALALAPLLAKLCGLTWARIAIGKMCAMGKGPSGDRVKKLGRDVRPISVGRDASSRSRSALSVG
jgi:hypothetical protein